MGTKIKISAAIFIIIIVFFRFSVIRLTRKWAGTADSGVKFSVVVFSSILLPNKFEDLS